MQLLFSSLALVVAFYFLAKVCDDYFIKALDKISHKLKLSSEAAGATLMAVGSSAAELFVALIALIKPGDHADLGMGTIVGSAIFNILVIIGLSAVIVKRTKITWQPVVRDTFFYAVAIIVLLMTFRDGNITIDEALIFLILYVVYIVAVINWQKILPYPDQEKAPEPEEEKSKNLAEKALALLFPKEKHYILIFSISILLIAGLSWIVVEAAIQISHILNIPESIIALTVLAIGTSVPDTISSVIVARQGRGDMAISNSIGSNIFDILFGLGFPWMLALLIQGREINVSTENLWSSVILLFATVLVILFLLIIRKWRIGNKSGYFLIVLYLGYLAWAISNSGIF